MDDLLTVFHLAVVQGFEETEREKANANIE